uniref:Uncharacterized protein n=1 Tax=Ditylenchus dipsaci TaxID=166011 RepID=A0A915D5W7_9BILA
MVDALTENIVKDHDMSESLRRKNISLEYLLAAYNFVGRFLALERIVIREDDEPGYGEVNDSARLAQFALPVPLELNGVDKLCHNLVNAFGSTRDTFRQRTSLVKYLVGVSYKGDPEQKVQLRKCVLAMLVDAVSANCAVQDYPTRKSYALDYLERCKEARHFLCANFSKLAEAVLKNKVRTIIIDDEDDVEEDGQQPYKKIKMMDDIGDGISSVHEYLDDTCFIALVTFLTQLKAMGFPIVKNLVIWLTKFMVNVKDSDLLEQFEWTQGMEEWLVKEKLVTQELD